MVSRRPDIATRAREARRMLTACNLCPRRCGVNRLEGEIGYCGLDGGAYWFREMIHYGQEMEVIPSHSIYLAGCNMRCVFCTALYWNTDPQGAEPWDTAAMKARVELRREEGARTLLFVGGEPTLSLPAILDLLAELPDDVPIVWDSNMYFSPEARALLRGVVDVYVADLKFGNDRCAQEVAVAPDYLEAVMENLSFAEDTASLIVRHLLMPGHTECCFKPAMELLRRELRAPRLALRGEYMPPVRPPRQSALARYLSNGEFQRALTVAEEMAIELVD